MKATISVELLVAVILVIIVSAVLFGLINPSISLKERSASANECKTNLDCSNSILGSRCINIENVGWKCGCILNSDCENEKKCKNNICS